MIDLKIFVQAQENIYEQALAELKNGSKESHWMWFVFPQIAGLGNSVTTRKYAIPNLADAKAYLSHDLLGSRLRECTEAVLAVEGRTAHEIFGSPDDMKLKSCMTLFELADSPDLIFSDILDKYFECQRDERSLAILNAPLS
jgi:uncharacterized protein (DUF1810 family)